MAHELGHAVLHRRQREGDIEAAANEFANELLLPRRVLIREWPRNPTLLSLLPLKENWGLSLQALMEHGFRAGLIDESRRMSLYSSLVIVNGRTVYVGASESRVTICVILNYHGCSAKW